MKPPKSFRGEGKKVRVVSMISPALFLSQPKDFRDKILVPWTPVFALSSGLPVLFDRVVGGFGKACGLERFGASAPAGVLEKDSAMCPRPWSRPPRNTWQNSPRTWQILRLRIKDYFFFLPGGLGMKGLPPLVLPASVRDRTS